VSHETLRRSDRWRTRGFWLAVAGMLLAFSSVRAQTENCLSATDMDAPMRSGLVSAAQKDFQLVTRGDSATLRQSSIPSVADNFDGIAASIKDNQSALAGAKAEMRPPFLLEAESTQVIPHAEFLCGVFGKNGQTAKSAVFYLDNLPPGKYGVVIFDAAASSGARTVSLVLQQQNAEWKLAGFYVRPAESGGHDTAWYIDRAREFASKGQVHNAWLYYLEARMLVSPLPFMSTSVSDQLYDESQKVLPADLPAEGKTTDLTVGGTSYKLTAIFPDAVGDNLDLVVKYEASDIANTNQTYQRNEAVMKALLAKYPELRDAFAAVVARAVDPSGHDYGTLLAMKDIK